MQQVLDWIAALPPLWGYLVLALASLIEYIFPPFPGDTITLLGAVLIETIGWWLPAVLAAVTAGSVMGALIDYEVGVWIGNTQGHDTWLHRKLTSDAIAPKVELLCERFARHGAIYIALNRFLPGVRAFFFVVAGTSGVSREWAMVWAAISALAWNLLIVGVGYAIGFELDALMGWMTGYTRVVYSVLLALTVWVAGRWTWRRVRSGKESPHEGDKNLPVPTLPDITREPRDADP